jgi:hypothetical protein
VENAGHAVTDSVVSHPAKRSFLQRNADYGDRSLRLHYHPFEYVLEVSKQAIDRRGAEEMRLTDTVPPRPSALSRRIKIASNIVVVTMGNSMIVNAMRSSLRP